MDIYADVRCLQDPNYAYRGVGHHSSTLLASRRDYLPHSRLIGMIDPKLPELSLEYQLLFDCVQPWSKATCVSPQSIFLQMSPMTHDQEVCGRLLDRPGILSAAVVYDFIPLDIPDRYLAAQAALHEYAAGLLWLDAYDHFAPISVYSETRLIEILNVSRTDSHVTGVTLRESFQNLHAKEIDSLASVTPRQNRDQVRPYFLFVGGGDPRKNIDLVLDAHAKLSNLGIRTDLVVVGSYTDNCRRTHAERYQALNGSVHNIKYQRDISDSELASLYKNALASICSSHIEGFSLPVIEAIACGSPALVSDCEAHRELVANPNTRFSPTDSEALCKLMKRMHSDKEFRQKVLEEQQQVPCRFYRDEVAAKFWEPLVQQYQQRFAQNNNQWYHNSYTLPSLAILSPFPPDRSGVADYTKRTVEALEGKAQVDIFTDAESPDACSQVNEFFKIDDWAYRSGKYDRVLSVTGNSHFHTKIIDLQRAYGGPCLMHDNRLAELYSWWKGPEYFRQLSCKSFNREVSLEESQSWIADPGKLPGIFFDEIIESSNPLIVHSRGIQKQVERQYGVQAKHLPFSCYRTFTEDELTLEQRRAARQRLNMTDDALHIVTFGIVGSSKAPEKCIDAIRLLRNQSVNAHFYFVGSCDTNYRKVLDQCAANLGVLDQVHFSADWIDDATYRDYVIAGDYAIQLRTHFFGGLSGAMLDCICSGLPTVANDDLAEALDAPETVLRVSDQMKASEVAQALMLGISKGSHLNRLVSCRQQYITEHSFDRYADSLLEVLKLRSSRSAPNVQVHVA